MSYPQTNFRFTTFSPDSFWAPRRDVVRNTTLRYQLNMLKETGRYDAFRLKWHPIYDEPVDPGGTPKHLFWDSDVAKWIEGACYFLEEQDDSEIDEAVKELVEMVRSAQQDDGYLNIHFTVVKPNERFTNIRDLHELYNAGHLIEASLIHHQHYNNDLLLEPILKYVNLLSKTFGPRESQIHGYPGHPEIELALLRLHNVTHDPEHLSLARYFIEERGNPVSVDGKHFYVAEAEERGEQENEMPNAWPDKQSFWYQQAHQPICDQESIEGHSVRAMYLLTAVADLMNTDLDSLKPKYRKALSRLWNNMVDKKMYLTGGIGAMDKWEGFGIDYFLPQGTDEGGCYAETCAAIGVMMLAERMLQTDLNGHFADIMELCLYNAMLTSMSSNGKEFTYVNQLASSDRGLSRREKWFQCACCPPNITRTFGMLGGYFWTFGQEGESEAEPLVYINVHQYTSATLKFSLKGNDISLAQKSRWPWEGKVQFTLQAPSTLKTTIRLRIPTWATGWKIYPQPPSLSTVQKNYLSLPPSWLHAHPKFTLTISGFQPRLITPHPHTNQNIVAVARGPLVYCLEDVDNPWETSCPHFQDLWFDTSASLVESPLLQHLQDPSTQEHPSIILITAKDAGSYTDLGAWDQAETGGGAFPGRTTTTTTTASLNNETHHNANDDTKPSTPTPKPTHTHTLKFIPYYYRANRGGNGHIRVGLNALWFGKREVVSPTAWGR
ncbi:MAG: hypothetical protein M1834_006713 [Cirrosporium novae-zelandiae]|nr:MAG: hypothetical protein M1834_006713 [Cirrosporium novae-zelandiae]